jgi:hypothetical protein
LAHPADIALPRRTEQVAVLAAQLRRALVADSPELLTVKLEELRRPVIADYDERPRSAAIAGAEQRVLDLKAQMESNRPLSTSLAFD